MGRSAWERFHSSGGIRFFQHVLDNGITLVHEGPLSPCWVERPDSGLISRKEMLDGLREAGLILFSCSHFTMSGKGVGVASPTI